MNFLCVVTVWHGAGREEKVKQRDDKKFHSSVSHVRSVPHKPWHVCSSVSLSVTKLLLVYPTDTYSNNIFLGTEEYKKIKEFTLFSYSEGHLGYQ
jgi:hypothetical protein